MNKSKILIFLFCIICLFVVVAATRQLTTSQTSANLGGIPKFNSVNGYSLVDSGVVIDSNTNMSGVNTQNVVQINSSVVTILDGFLFLQKSSGPSASDLGGTIGSITNHQIRNVGGILYDYWSDGTTLYGPKQISP